MPFQEDFYQFRTATTESKEFVETPIFIGTAVKLVEVITTNGSTSLSIPEQESGLQYKNGYYEADISYWEILGDYYISSIDSERKTISTIVTSEYRIPIISTTEKFTCFVINTNTNEIIFSSGISKINYNIEIGDEISKTVSSLVLLEEIPSNINITSPSYKINISKINSFHYNTGTCSETSNTVSLNLSLINCINVTNLNTIISCHSYYYYNIIDYRYKEINITDSIPDEFLPNKNNKLGNILEQYQKVCSEKVVLYTIPNETYESFLIALSNINELGNSLGYYIVPLFFNDNVNKLLSDNAKLLEINESIFTTNLVPYKNHFYDIIIPTFTITFNEIPN